MRRYDDARRRTRWVGEQSECADSTDEEKKKKKKMKKEEEECQGGRRITKKKHSEERKKKIEIKRRQILPARSQPSTSLLKVMTSHQILSFKCRSSRSRHRRYRRPRPA